ncbi:hypothetical protein HAX54_024535 [Datura stramonium]|uniref:Uncharacterized protein n=1 Tax=Datura stramonium TaxID=4076 RepID=A0ABS8S5G6_DATST|nr:hypothetical protein [Datura stramonium]
MAKGRGRGRGCGHGRGPKKSIIAFGSLVGVWQTTGSKGRKDKENLSSSVTKDESTGLQLPLLDLSFPTSLIHVVGSSSGKLNEMGGAANTTTEIPADVNDGDDQQMSTPIQGTVVSIFAAKSPQANYEEQVDTTLNLENFPFLSASLDKR